MLTVCSLLHYLAIFRHLLSFSLYLWPNVFKNTHLFIMQSPTKLTFYVEDDVIDRNPTNSGLIIRIPILMKTTKN